MTSEFRSVRSSNRFTMDVYALLCSVVFFVTLHSNKLVLSETVNISPISDSNNGPPLPLPDLPSLDVDAQKLPELPKLPDPKDIPELQQAPSLPRLPELPKSWSDTSHNEGGGSTGLGEPYVVQPPVINDNAGSPGFDDTDSKSGPGESEANRDADLADIVPPRAPVVGTENEGDRPDKDEESDDDYDYREETEGDDSDGDWYDPNDMESEGEDTMRDYYDDTEKNKEGKYLEDEWDDENTDAPDHDGEDDDENYDVNKWGNLADEDGDDDNDWGDDADNAAHDDFEENHNTIVEDVVDEELARKNKTPTAPTSMVLFYTWMIVVILILVVGLSTYQARCKGGLRLPFFSRPAQGPGEDKKRLLDHEYV